jgi:hypothetical protein
MTDVDGDYKRRQTNTMMPTDVDDDGDDEENDGRRRRSGECVGGRAQRLLLHQERRPAQCGRSARLRGAGQDCGLRASVWVVCGTLTVVFSGRRTLFSGRWGFVLSIDGCFSEYGASISSAPI